MLELATERLLLRPHRADDAEFMVELNSDPAVVRYTGDGAVNLAEAKRIIASLRAQYLKEKIGRFVVIEKATARRVGWGGLKRLPETGEIDLGYRFLRSEWGKGYATETAAACLAYGFLTLGFRRITAQADPRNAASIRVLQKIGMIESGSGLGFEIEKEGFLRRSKTNGRLPG
ncbi:MAG: GNAT family N-acetyltransferase [Elusimicrobiota bacterium]